MEEEEEEEEEEKKEKEIEEEGGESLLGAAAVIRMRWLVMVRSALILSSRAGEGPLGWGDLAWGSAVERCGEGGCLGWSEDGLLAADWERMLSLMIPSAFLKRSSIKGWWY